MAYISRDLVFAILQYLNEENFKEAMHKLEKESGFYFNMRYLEDAVTNGEWEDLENYLMGFTKIDTHPYSTIVFFEIRKQKFLEALDMRDDSKAVKILREELKGFPSPYDVFLKDLSMLLTLQNFRENVQLSHYGDTTSARALLFVQLRHLIESNPLFSDKLRFPTLRNSTLKMLISQSVNWQHQQSRIPKPTPDIRTLSVDQNFALANSGQVPSPATNPLMGSMGNVGWFPWMSGPAVSHSSFPAPSIIRQQPLQHAPGHLTNSPAMSNPSSVPHPAISNVAPRGLNPPNTSASLSKRPRTPTDVSTRRVSFSIPEEAKNRRSSLLPAVYPGQSHGHAFQVTADDLPKFGTATFNLGSLMKTMDFHPVQQTLLLVGTNIGAISIWEVSGGNRLAVRNFEVWDLGACSTTFQASLAKEHSASVNRVKWSPDGNLVGVAYSKHLVHLFSYSGDSDLRNHREIDSHSGSVNDLAFSYLDKQLCVVTCGDDKTIKVWDAATGDKQFVFEGHKAPVYSVCPHSRKNIPYILSNAVDGKIKAWLYDQPRSIVEYDAPGHSRTTMAYCADGSRLFSCGTSEKGESFLVEWDDHQGSIKRTYLGVSKCSVGMVQFDTAKNRLLAVGDDFLIKFWDMDNENIFRAINAGGGDVSACIRFNKDGSLLAVSTYDNGFKILANTGGVQLMRDTRSGVKSKATTTLSPVGTSSSAPGTRASADRSSPNIDSRNTRIASELDQSKFWELTEMNEPSQLRSLRLPDGPSSVKIIRLIYTNSGDAILALACNAVHKLWKWKHSDRNVSGKATSAVLPQFWLPSSGILMTNIVSETNQKEAVPCFALSENDSHVMSASGGTISLFDMSTFKTMTTFMPPPPAATFLAFHPQDSNVIAVGMEDATIQIYNIQLREVKSTLKCHQKRVTGLTFSNVLHVLVSSGDDAQICVWSLDQWEKKATTFLQITPGVAPNPLAHTRIQFHQDQTHLLVAYETKIAVYEASKLDCVYQCATFGSSIITDATYSCDGQLIYTSFDSGRVCVFTSAGLKLRCRVNLTAYLPNSNPSSKVYPLVITAHPSEPNQFAVGLTDGGVHVLEPLETEEKWGTDPPHVGVLEA